MQRSGDATNEQEFRGAAVVNEARARSMAPADRKHDALPRVKLHPATTQIAQGHGGSSGAGSKKQASQRAAIVIRCSDPPRCSEC